MELEKAQENRNQNTEIKKETQNAA
jgi:hypothetical protein